MISISDLDFWYSKKSPLIRKLNVNLATGKIHGILGLNGTGKSTLLKLIVGNLFAKSGSVTVQEFNISDRHTSILQDIYYLPEELDTPSTSITKYVNAHSVFYPNFDIQKFNQVLLDFKVQVQSKLNQLSLGQKKKVLIAFGLATNTKIIVFDEPTNGLDIPSKSQFRKIIAKELSDDQMLIISTHQVRDLGQMLDTVVILDQGKIIFNHDIQTIEQKLLFIENNSESSDSDSLYSEKSMGNYIHILPNKDMEPSEIRLEVLFNAITENTNLITEQFNHRTI